MLPLLGLTPTSRVASVSDLKQGSGLGGGAPSQGCKAGGLAHRFPTAGREWVGGFWPPE